LFSNFNDKRDLNGFLYGHSYTVIRVELSKQGDKLINLKNPFDATNWQGEFSENH
jgi:hypothetical protein